MLQQMLAILCCMQREKDVGSTFEDYAQLKNLLLTSAEFLHPEDILHYQQQMLAHQNIYKP